MLSWIHLFWNVISFETLWLWNEFLSDTIKWTNPLKVCEWCDKGTELRFNNCKSPLCPLARTHVRRTPSMHVSFLISFFNGHAPSRPCILPKEASSARAFHRITSVGGICYCCYPETSEKCQPATWSIASTPPPSGDKSSNFPIFFFLNFLNAILLLPICVTDNHSANFVWLTFKYLNLIN